MKDRYNPAEVREMLNVSNDLLKLWRSPARLKGGTANPLYLPVVKDSPNSKSVWYLHDDLVAFLRRNDKYQDRFLASFAPPYAHQFLQGASAP